MKSRFGSIKEDKKVHVEYLASKDQTGFSVDYAEDADSVKVALLGAPQPTAVVFSTAARDEAHILYMESCELLRTRAKALESAQQILIAFDKLFGEFRGGGAALPSAPKGSSTSPKGDIFTPNPGKQIAVEVDGVSYLRLPVRTRLITTADTDLLPIIEEYAKPHFKEGDFLFVSEKALCVTQSRIINMSAIRVTPLARLFARNVENHYGTQEFHGFGHGTDLAMQLLIEEAGYPRAIFAAAVAVVTRPLGIRGMFYYLCGKQAKSIDCPMSFLILEYAHYAKLAPKDPNGAARRFKERLGHETVILDANYRGAFSLGKSTSSISEGFVQQLFKDNPLGQSDEMTPFCIVRKA
jgi:hypothetical protein